jgi:protein-S-isoprenylcysteine O-methyltransferase Ste14
MQPFVAVYIPWFVWAVTWIAAALWANRTLKRPGVGQEWLYRLVTLTGFILLLMTPAKYANGHLTLDPTLTPFSRPLWHLPAPAGWALVGAVGGGFLFAWWARIHLGRLWSGSITRKQDHRVVDTGPYAIVRHPIYTGIIVAGFATAAVTAMPRALLGAILLLVGYWLKARIEERFLRAELGAQAYDAYAARTAMLVPFVKL